jgi:hypothetical protein
LGPTAMAMGDDPGNESQLDCLGGNQEGEEGGGWPRIIFISLAQRRTGTMGRGVGSGKGATWRQGNGERSRLSLAGSLAFSGLRPPVRTSSPGACLGSTETRELEAQQHNKPRRPPSSPGPAGKAWHATYRNETRMPTKECIVVSVLTGSGLRGLAGRKRRTAWKCWNCGKCADLGWKENRTWVSLCATRGGRDPVAGLAQAQRVWHWSLAEPGQTRWIAKDRRLIPTDQQTRPDFCAFCCRFHVP